MNIVKQVTLALLSTVLLSLAAPAPSGATVHEFEMLMVEGSVDVGNLMFETPDVGIEECESGLAFTGLINSTTGTVSGSTNIDVNFTWPFDGNHYTLVAHTESAATHGTYNAGTGTFSGLHAIFTFAIHTIDTVDCTTLETECVGTATLTISGGLNDGSTLPLSTGEQIYVNGVGAVTSVPFATCRFIWWLVLNGADLAIGPNTTIGTSPGAIFEQD